VLTHRIARFSDLPQVVAIYNATVAGRMVTADIQAVSVESRHAWFEQHSANFRPLWVVEVDRQIAAWLSFSSFYGRPAYNKTAELSIYVDEQFRRKGIASYLLQQAINHAPALHVDTLLGFIFAHNTPSLTLFERFGFQRWGHLPGVAQLDEVERDLVIVGKRVS